LTLEALQKSKKVGQHISGNRPFT